MGFARRLAAVTFCCAMPVAPAAAAGAAQSWAKPEIRVVTTRGIFRGPVATFRADAPLTRQALAHAVAKLTGGTETKVENSSASVSLEELDATLVSALGLGDAAYRIYLGAQRSGLRPPPRFGTEVVARLLGLRLNHPVGQEDLELQPQQIATRAEAAYSVAQIVDFDGGSFEGGHSEWDGSRGSGGHSWRHRSRHVSSAAATRVDFSQSWRVQAARAAADSFELPELMPWQRRVLGAAVSYIGFPYIWGGTGQGTPGFDCSGFVWRVYKLTSYAGERSLAGVLRGRTTMEMSGEAPPARRIAFKHLQPGDVLFFGNGPRSKPAQVDHTGIYLGNGWFIHSSGYGVAVASLDGWHRSSFAWARRPLAEAGLA